MGIMKLCMIDYVSKVSSLKDGEEGWAESLLSLLQLLFSCCKQFCACDEGWWGGGVLCNCLSRCADDSGNLTTTEIKPEGEEKQVIRRIHLFIVQTGTVLLAP